VLGCGCPYNGNYMLACAPQVEGLEGRLGSEQATAKRLQSEVENLSTQVCGAGSETAEVIFCGSGQRSCSRCWA